MTANVIKLTGILPEIAFNLALPTYFAFTAALVASIAYNLTELARRAVKRSPGFRRIPAWSSLWAAGLAVFLVLLAGNFRGMAQGLDRLSEASPWQSDVPLAGPVIKTVGGAWKLLTGGDIPYDYWDPSRAIHLTPDQQDQTAPITEFPMFTFMFADLHAHLMVMPVSLLSLAVGLAAVTTAREAKRWPRARRMALEWTFVALLGLLVGTARWTNSWDYPTFGLMAAASLFIAQWYGDRGLSLPTLGMWLLKSAAVLAVSLVLFSPASRHFLPPATGFHRAEQTTQLDDYLWHFGLFVLIAAVALGVWLFRSMGRTFSLGALRAGSGVSWSLGALVIAAPAVFVFAATQRGRIGVVALAVVMLAVIAWLAARELARPRPDTHVRLFVLAMFAMAFGLGGGVDLFTLNDDITRMNTVFKFYLHSWLLFGIASAVAVWYVVAVMRPGVAARRAARGAAATLAALRPYLTPAFAAALAVTLAGVALYPMLALPQRIDERFAELPRSINGMNFMAHATFNDFDDMGELDLSKDYEGILWMRERVQGSPTILEGVTPGYRWGSRYSIYTGLPAVAGWDWHQRQQRGKFGYLVTKRQQDVTTFYESADPTEQVAILDRYDVRYVVLGQLERNYFPGPGLANIEAGLNGRLQKVFDNGSTAIYAVTPRPIPGPPLATAP
jgi:YYY domain-containing protein